MDDQNLGVVGLCGWNESLPIVSRCLTPLWYTITHVPQFVSGASGFFEVSFVREYSVKVSHVAGKENSKINGRKIIAELVLTFLKVVGYI